MSRWIVQIETLNASAGQFYGYIMMCSITNGTMMINANQTLKDPRYDDEYEDTTVK